MPICPKCGQEKERIAQHWAMSSCGYPDIPEDILAVTDGIVLAGGTVAGNGTNPHVEIGIANEELSNWIVEQLGWLCQSIREQDSAGPEQVYRIRTPAHPQLHRYERWTKLSANSGRQPPEHYRLSARAGRVWWAFAGGIQSHGEYDSQYAGTFSALSDGKADWIQHARSVPRTILRTCPRNRQTECHLPAVMQRRTPRPLRVCRQPE